MMEMIPKIHMGRLGDACEHLSDLRLSHVSRYCAQQDYEGSGNAANPGAEGADAHGLFDMSR